MDNAEQINRTPGNDLDQLLQRQAYNFQHSLTDNGASGNYNGDSNNNLEAIIEDIVPKVR